MITFFNKTIAKRTPLGQRQSVQNQGNQLFIIIWSSSHPKSWRLAEYFVHVHMRTDGLCACITCDAEYNPRVAFSLMTRLMEDFTTFCPGWLKETRNEAISWPQLDSDIVKYQDPANADQIMVRNNSLVVILLGVSLSSLFLFLFCFSLSENPKKSGRDARRVASNHWECSPTRWEARRVGGSLQRTELAVEAILQASQACK